VPPSVQAGPIPTPQVRRASLAAAKPAAKKNNSGLGLLPLLLIGVFVLNALRAYQRNATHFNAPPPPVVSPRYFTPQTPLFSPGPPTRTIPAAPTPAPYNGSRAGSVDELHWSDTPRWSPHRDPREGDPWHPVSPRPRQNGWDR
jgi:hypothetical protein